MGEDAGEASKISAPVFKSDQKAPSLAKNMFPIIFVCLVNIFYLQRLRRVGTRSVSGGAHPAPAAASSLSQSGRRGEGWKVALQCDSIWVFEEPF